MDATDVWRLGMAWARERPGLCERLRMTPEDIGGEAAVEYLESGRRGPRAIIDRLRKLTGKRGSAKQRGTLRTYLVLDRPITPGEPATRGDALAAGTDEYAAADERDRLRRAAADCTARTRRIMVLYADGWNMREIGDALGVTQEAVKKALRAARPPSRVPPGCTPA